MIVWVQQLSEAGGAPIGAPIEVPMLDKLPLPRRPGEPTSQDYFFSPGSTGMGGIGR